jgi:protein SCO1/2
MAALVAVSALVAGCSAGGSTAARSSDLNPAAGNVRGYEGVGLDPAQPRPSITLTDTAGKPFDLAKETGGRPTFLYFGYTNCPDVCPATLADVAVVLRKMPAIAKRAYVVFVTTDPAHDTGQVIKKWFTNFPDTDATWVGLHGARTQIDAAQAAAHVTVATDAGRSHSTELLLYGADNYAHVAFLWTNSERAQIAHDLPVVAN